MSHMTAARAPLSDRIIEVAAASATTSTSSSSTSSSTASSDSVVVPSPPAHPFPASSGSAGALPGAIQAPDLGREEQLSQRPPTTLVEKLQDMAFDNSVVINTFIAGGIAGATSRTVVSPLERLKIILQVQSAGHVAATSGKAYGGVMTSLARMWREEGFAGFMKGNGINVVRVGETVLAIAKLQGARCKDGELIGPDSTIFRVAIHSMSLLQILSAIRSIH